MNQPAVVGVSGTPKLADKMAQFDAKKFAGKASQISYFHLAIQLVPYTNRIWPGLTEFGPLPWQAKQTVSALCQLQPAT